MDARPPSGRSEPVSIFMVVDLPAPFGPRNPRTSPRATEKLIPSTAVNGPNFFTSPSISIIAAADPPLVDDSTWFAVSFAVMTLSPDQMDLVPILPPFLIPL